MLSSGALAIRFTFLPLFGQYVLRYGATERGQTTERVPSTLLGPEEAAAFEGRLLERARARAARMRRGSRVSVRILRTA
jgi:hypothetical protein